MIARAITIALIVFSAQTSQGAVERPPKEGKYEALFCFSGENHIIATSDSMLGGSFRVTGIQRTPRPGDHWDGLSGRCDGAWALVNGTFEEHGSCELIDADGDKHFGQFSRIGTKGVWRAFGGTGKYVGLTVNGEYEPAGSFPTAEAGTVQGCSRSHGTWKLP